MAGARKRLSLPFDASVQRPAGLCERRYEALVGAAEVYFGSWGRSYVFTPPYYCKSLMRFYVTVCIKKQGAA